MAGEAPSVDVSSGLSALNKLENDKAEKVFCDRPYRVKLCRSSYNFYSNNCIHTLLFFTCHCPPCRCSGSLSIRPSTAPAKRRDLATTTTPKFCRWPSIPN